MKAKIKYRVVRNLHIELEMSGRLAHNICFSWKEDIRDLFQRIDPRLWVDCGQNLVLMLGLVSQDRLNELSRAHGFLRQLEQVG